MDGYSNVTFNPVVAKGIRLTMTPSKDGNAIIKWKVYGWPDADVSQVEIPVMGVELNKDEILFTEAGASETLTATVTPDNATNTNVTWSSDRPEVATVDQNGKVWQSPAEPRHYRYHRGWQEDRLLRGDSGDPGAWPRA